MMKRLFNFLWISISMLFLVLFVYLAAHNIPRSSEYVVKTVKITKIYEGGVKDIVFEEDNGNFYYINRGLEQDYTLEELEAQLLNKNVTLHLKHMLAGVSSHINQLTYEDTIVYTELNQ